MVRALSQGSLKNTIFLVLLFFGSGLFSGCSWLVAPPQDQVEARMLVEQYSHANDDIQHFKGLGNIRIHSKQQLLSGRMVWAATMPNKLRVEMLAVLWDI